MSNIKNGDMPIAPIVMDNGHPYHQSQVALENHPQMIGLTKREQFAAMAMQGLLANAELERFYDGVELMAVEKADALLAELEK